MAEEMLNGRAATDFEADAIEHARECELKRGRELLGGLLAEYPREQAPAPRPVTTLAELP